MFGADCSGHGRCARRCAAIGIVDSVQAFGQQATLRLCRRRCRVIGHVVADAKRSALWPKIMVVQQESVGPIRLALDGVEPVLVRLCLFRVGNGRWSSNRMGISAAYVA